MKKKAKKAEKPKAEKPHFLKLTLMVDDTPENRETVQVIHDSMTNQFGMIYMKPLLKMERIEMMSVKTASQAKL